MPLRVAVVAVGFGASGGLADPIQLPAVQSPGHGEEGKTLGTEAGHLSWPGVMVAVTHAANMTLRHDMRINKNVSNLKMVA